MVRLFDLRLPSNRFVLIAPVLALVGVAAFGAGAPAPVPSGIEAGFTVLLSWALARELDPDEPASATVAAFAGLLILPTGTPSLGAVTTLLFAIRVVTRNRHAGDARVRLPRGPTRGRGHPPGRRTPVDRRFAGLVGAPGGSRTHTRTVLSRLPLPVGVRGPTDILARPPHTCPEGAAPRGTGARGPRSPRRCGRTSGSTNGPPWGCRR